MLHPGASGRQQLLNALAPMAQLVRERGYAPEAIDIQTGKDSGPAASGFSAAVLPFLQAQKENTALETQRTRMDARPIRSSDYYQQALSLFGLGWLEGFFRFSAAGQLQPRWMP
jgi:endoglucanase